MSFIPLNYGKHLDFQASDTQWGTVCPGLWLPSSSGCGAVFSAEGTRTRYRKRETNSSFDSYSLLPLASCSHRKTAINYILPGFSVGSNRIMTVKALQKHKVLQKQKALLCLKKSHFLTNITLARLQERQACFWGLHPSPLWHARSHQHYPMGCHGHQGSTSLTNTPRTLEGVAEKRVRGDS